MSSIKAYTDLSQSKKLAEILPIESADMGWYYSCNPQAARNQMWVGTKPENADVPCWSLAALLSVVSEEVSLNSFKNGCWNAMVKLIYADADNPIDACYELILKLHELKML